MTPHRGNLLARHRITPSGRLEAWSIQGRYGVFILAVGLGMSIPWLHFQRQAERPEGFWFMTTFIAAILLFGVAIARLRETLRVDDAGIHHEFRSVWRSLRWHTPRDAACRVTLKAVIDGRGESRTTD